MVNLNFDSSSHYTRIATKQKVSRAPSIGFEWEMPLLYDQYEDEDYMPDDEYEKRYKLYRDYGYRLHHECGGAEICSPIFPTLNIAKGHARWAIKFERLNDFTDAELGNEDERCCGIHVHVTDPTHYNNTVKHRYQFVQLISSILNDGRDMAIHEKTENFIKKISGRFRTGYCGAYQYNAQVSPELSYMTKGGLLGTSVEELLCHGRLADHDDMVRDNGYHTVEFRIFGPTPDRLLVAIDFSHSLFKFVRTRVDISKPLKEFPTLLDWKAWVNKQKGYKDLKNDTHFKSYGE